MEKHILVAVDGSIYSHKTLHYLTRLFEDLEDISVHLLSIIPCGSLPSAREWLDQLDLMSMISPEARKSFAAAKRSMSEAVLQLGRLGIEPQRVTTSVQLAAVGVAADLLHEARKGLYDAIVIGRRGLGRLEQLIMGSVSTTILEKCDDVPVWIVDGRVDSRKFLVPLDGSPHTLRAVDHLAHILSGNPYAEVTLFHASSALMPGTTYEPHTFHAQWGAEWCELHLSRPDSLFHAPEQILLEAGFPEKRIRRVHSHKGLHPSHQIIRQALIDGMGTIVMGRRPHDLKKGWLGSVSHKVIANIEDVAIWLVS